jgi:hypothetical protein
MPVRWCDLYSETELLRAALRIYTKPVFQWRKALGTSTDNRTFYDFARHGLRNLSELHGRLMGERFAYRAGAARDVNFNGKRRTLYIYPWEEKIVDLLLYRLLNRAWQPLFSPSSYAYRVGSHGVDVCQARIARRLREMTGTVYIFKRDIARYFDSIDHNHLRALLDRLIDADDYLMRLLEQRIAFAFERNGVEERAVQGVPFGTPVACVLANLFLTGLDRQMDAMPGLYYFRYADDLLGISAEPDAIRVAAKVCDDQLKALGLTVKPSHSVERALTVPSLDVPGWVQVPRFKHLGLEFRANGCTGLTRDKTRKIRNLFRYAWRRKAGRLRRTVDPMKRAALAVQVARDVIENGLRNVAIIDYYLKHVRDEAQLREIDRWLAGAVLSIVFQNGHKKGNFRRISFGQLRRMGLPSLVHRSRLIRNRQITTSFLRWKEYQVAKLHRDRSQSWQVNQQRQRGTTPGSALTQDFLPGPESSRHITLVGESDGLLTGGIEDTSSQALVSLSSRSPLAQLRNDERSGNHHGTV